MNNLFVFMQSFYVKKHLMYKLADDDPSGVETHSIHCF